MNETKKYAWAKRTLLPIWLATAIVAVQCKGETSQSSCGDYRSRLAPDCTATSLRGQIELLPTGMEWVGHIQRDLLPYWTSRVAIGNPPGNFPTFRANDGSVIDPKNPPPEFRDIPDTETWLKPRVGRQYSRMMGRQIFAYCVAFHMTGDEKYLDLAKKGTDYLLENMVDKDGRFYTWMENGKGYPEKAENRISQDMTYALLGPAMYYYLTRGKEILNVLLKTERYIFDSYKFPDADQLRWVIENYTDLDETDTTTQKELVAQLDQIYAYMLLTTGILEDPYRKAWLNDMLMLAHTIKDDYFSPENNMFWGRIDEPKYKKLGMPHVDFGHTIKTFWMLYLIGKRFNQQDLVSFALNHMPRVFQEAYYPPMGTWIEKKLEDGELGTDRIWWVHDELDQAAATLALVEPEHYVKYLIPTYRFWFLNFVDRDGKEVWHGLTGPLPGKPMLLKAHLWKNSSHVFEHALVGYITSQALRKEPVDLYFAFIEKPKDSGIEPYLFNGDIQEIKLSELELPGFADKQKYKVTFTNITP